MSRTNPSTSRIRRRTSDRVLVGFCHRDEYSAYFGNSLLRMQMNCPQMADFIGVRSGPRIDDARNEIFRLALGTDCTHVLMVDTDMVLPVDLIPRLLAHRKPIVGGLTFSGGLSGKIIPSMRQIITDERGKPTLEPYWDYPKNSLFRVDAHGAAALLVERAVIQKILEARGPNHAMPWFAQSMHNGVAIGEDVAFCLTAAKVGFQVWCDSSLDVLHHKAFFIGEQEFQAARDQPVETIYALPGGAP